jgi:hypothetical protein
VDATVWPLLNGGCHTARDIVADLAAAGFSVTERQAFVFPANRPNHPASRFVLGTAQRT